MGRLFGTDGIRGEVNIFPMTCEMVFKIGRAIGLFVKENEYGSVVIGKDTRISGDMLEAALSAGMASTGVQVFQAGILPTPGVAFLCADNAETGAGVVISASHNPFGDNGIKIFTHEGSKLSDAQEARIEDLILNSEPSTGAAPGRIFDISDGLERYARFLISKGPFKKNKPLKLVIDCSNGAASEISHLVFGSDRFDAVFIHDAPDGMNINHLCGSEHTESLRQKVLSTGADLGLALDGDADRLIAMDETGQKITGDQILAVCAGFAGQRNKLSNNMVVSTIMSNVGLTEYLAKQGIQHFRTDVGDRKVLEEMRRKGAIMGGEDSGHLIFLDSHTTGDGLLSALKILEVMLNTGEPLSRLASVMTVYPQVLMNVQVQEKRTDIMKIPPIVETIRKIEKELGSRGRVLIRYSGTQPLIRVMVEGPDQIMTRHYCLEICEAIKAQL